MIEKTNNLQETDTTNRVTVRDVDDILYETIPVLDHGFIRVIDYMGDDSSIVQAARVSYGRGTKRKSQDQGLINYLMRHRHTTPFEMCELKLHVKLPIFIARQWIRHRSANVNEYSARYSILDNDCYIPEPEHIAAQSVVNNQGRGDVVSPEQAIAVQELLRQDANTCYDHYQELLNETEDGTIIDESKSGVARELARMNLTLNHYTQWYWKIDLHNLLHFISLRADSHSQYEIQAYAKVILDIVAKWVPMTHKAFMKYRFNGAFLSSPAIDAISQIIKGRKINLEDYDMSKREWDELWSSLNLTPDEVECLQDNDKLAVGA